MTLTRRRPRSATQLWRTDGPFTFYLELARTAMSAPPKQQQEQQEESSNSRNPQHPRMRRHCRGQSHVAGGKDDTRRGINGHEFESLSRNWQHNRSNTLPSYRNERRRLPAPTERQISENRPPPDLQKREPSDSICTEKHFFWAGMRNPVMLGVGGQAA